MVERGISPGQGSENQPSKQEAFQELFKGFCIARSVSPEKPVEYIGDTFEDKDLRGAALKLSRGELDPEDKKQKQQITEFLNKKLEEYPADEKPKEYLKIQKLRLITFRGKTWLESEEGKEHIKKIKQAGDLEALEKEIAKYRKLTLASKIDDLIKGREEADEKKRESEREREFPEEVLSEILSPEAIAKNVDLASVKILHRRMEGWDVDSLSLEAINRTSQEIERIEAQAAARLQGQTDNDGNASEEGLRRYQKMSDAIDLLYEILAKKQAEGTSAFVDSAEEKSINWEDYFSGSKEKVEGDGDIFEKEFLLSKKFIEALHDIATPQKDEDGKTKEPVIKSHDLYRRIEILLKPWVVTDRMLLSNELSNLTALMREEGISRSRQRELDSLARVIKRQVDFLGKQERSIYAKELPDELPAAFRTGSYRAEIASGQISEEDNFVFDVRNSEERDHWLFLNLSAFLNDMIISDSSDKWRQVVHYYRKEFATAWGHSGEKEDRGMYYQEKFKEFDKKIRSFMAVAAAARAMEFSAGSADSYVESVTGYRDGKLFLDGKDWYAPLTLQDDESKMVTVLSDPLVAHYYKVILDKAGVIIPDIVHSVDKKGKRIYPKPGSEEESEEKVDHNKRKKKRLKKGLTKWDYWIDKSKTFKKDEEGELANDRLVFHLEGKGGFDSFIDKVLEKEREEEAEAEAKEAKEKDLADEGIGKKFERSKRWVAAKMACDAFLTGLYTKWVIAIDPESKYKLKFSPREGGNPFQCILDPMFLTKTIKGMYRGEAGRKIVSLVNEAFRPDDLFYTVLRPPAVNKTVKLILDALPHKKEEELKQLPEEEIEKLVSDAIEESRILLDNIAKQDGTYFRKGTDPWSEIKKEIVKEKGLLSMTSGEKKEAQIHIGRSLVENEELPPEEKKQLDLVLWLRETIKEETAKAASVCDVSQIKPNATHHLKEYYRYASSLITILGGSRAPNLPEWNERTIEDLGKAVELLDDVYGKKGKDGKHLAGLMIARIIKAKVIASALEREKIDWKERVGQMFSVPSKRIETFQQAEEALFGQDLGKMRGIIGDLMGARRNIIIKGNKYGAEREIMEARQALRAAQALSSSMIGVRAVTSILKSIGENIY